jgi:thymidylate synthase
VILASDQVTISVCGSTIGETWEEGVRQLVTRDDLVTVDSEDGGPSVEAPLARLQVLEPDTEPQRSAIFPEPELIESYADLLREPQGQTAEETKTIASRIYAYERPDGTRIDQLALCWKELEENPASRRAIIQIWDPASDLAREGTASPASHLLLQLTVREDRVHLSVVSRSVDAWLGALPNMLGFFSLQRKTAEKLGLEIGSYSHLIVSFHIYLRDIPAARAALGG